MKKILLISLLYLSFPLAASINCLDNSKHLEESYDDKEWHSVACDCSCEKEIIKGNKCTVCQHLQNASTYVVVLPTKIALSTRKKVYTPRNPQTVIKNLALKYIEKK